MTLLDARILWNFNNNDDPIMELLLTHYPSGVALKHKIFEVDGNSKIYFAEIDKIAHFFRHDPDDETGFNGEIFPVRLQDGSYRLVKGPHLCIPGELLQFGCPRTMLVHIGLSDQYTTNWQSDIIGYVTDDLAYTGILIINQEMQHKDVILVEYDNHNLSVGLTKTLAPLDAKEIMRKRLPKKKQQENIYIVRPAAFLL